MYSSYDEKKDIKCLLKRMGTENHIEGLTTPKHDMGIENHLKGLPTPMDGH